ncbi:putative UPF0481 protein At3g02645 [Diospyros lotus]|uniref:putative UPF0481 protein At3g02645 n=1 Tax=Diospyros lotus TaxID=55363 RepID=UPI002250A89F|nr:putative UPF0481 protein At3g02645 [Diospyros lotus]
MPETMLMEKNNRTWICQLESYEKQNIKELKIQKVPAILRGVKSNKECYDPMIVAIGPYHHGKDELQQMETFKIQFTLQYADQSGKSIRKLYEEMQNSLVEAKNYYTEDVAEKFNDEKFAEMLFLDSCFVIQFMDSCVNSENNNIKTTNIDTAFIRRDIMLLENQLPLEILTKLMCLSLRFEGGQGFEMIDNFIKLIMKDPPIEEKAPRRKTCFLFFQTNSKSEETNRKKKKPIHLLELVRTKFVDDTKKKKKKTV